MKNWLDIFHLLGRGARDRGWLLPTVVTGPQSDDPINTVIKWAFWAEPESQTFGLVWHCELHIIINHETGATSYDYRGYTDGEHYVDVDIEGWTKTLLIWTRAYELESYGYEPVDGFFECLKTLVGGTGDGDAKLV